MSETTISYARTTKGQGTVPPTRATFNNSQKTAEYLRDPTAGKRLETFLSESASANGISADKSLGNQQKDSQPHHRAVEPQADPVEERLTPSNPQSGLYDVFAPAGPIGIVVDTTKYGPAVHSLKRTSPMLGLINPGDLIIALDDEDTRGMTAATLTRLMARKSSQKDRKITLLTSEPY